MKKLLFILTISLLSVLHAVTITSDKNIYSSQDKILLTASDMAGNQKDWIAIYPEGSSTAWNNVLQWVWTKGKINHTFTFQNLPAGDYEARVFFNNTYKIETSHKFKVKNQNPLPNAELISKKALYDVNERITIEAKNMSGAKKDWIAIYKAGTSNEWKNVLYWKWTEGKIEGVFHFHSLPEGEYEARAFFNNTYELETSTSFSVQNKHHFPTTIEVRKKVYQAGEHIQVLVNHMLGDKKDWVALFPKNSTNEWKNVIQWSTTGGEKSTIIGFDGLEAGEYEARAFFKNSYNVEASTSFTVAPNPDAIINYVKDICTHNKINKDVVCLENFNIAYYRKKDTVINEEILYAISTQGSWSHITKTYLGWFDNPALKKLANTPLLMIKTFGHQITPYSFYYTDINNKKITKLLTYTLEDNWVLDTIETLENGTKLSIKSHHNGSGEIYHKIYDISNLPQIPLIN